MKSSFVKKTGIALLLCSAWAKAGAMDAEALFDKLSPSIWVVRTYDAQKKGLALGTAVVIDNAHMITNCHVLARASSFTVQHLDVTLPASLEYPDIDHDLCQIKVSNLSAPAVNIAPISSLHVGQKVFALGAPRGLEETLSDGLLSALRLDQDGKLRYIQTTAPTAHGSSGGGLFNDKGELIGITTLGVDANYAQNVSFAVPAQWILDVPTRGKLALAQPRPAPVPASPPPPAKIALWPVPPQQPPAPPQPISRMLPASPASPVAPVTPVTPAIPMRPAAATVQWTGLMSCSARMDNGPYHDSYQAIFLMEVTGNSAKAYRKSSQKVAEVLTGTIVNNALSLDGFGHRLDMSDTGWQLKFSGEFSADASVFAGKGTMLLDAQPVRTCDLVLTRN